MDVHDVLSTVTRTEHDLLLLLVDVDECTETNNICGEGSCENYYGGYYCDCNQGYQQDTQDTKTAKCVG